MYMHIYMIDMLRMYESMYICICIYIYMKDACYAPNYQSRQGGIGQVDRYFTYIYTCIYHEYVHNYMHIPVYVKGSCYVSDQHIRHICMYVYTYVYGQGRHTSKVIHMHVHLFICMYM